MRFRCFSLLPLMGALAMPAAALEFSSVRVLSRLGEPLRAEIDVRAGAGDILGDSCLRLSRPMSRSLPPLTGLTLAFDGSSDAATLRIASPAPVLEPASSISIEANCGGGRLWHDVDVLLGPQGSGKRPDRFGEWVIVPGESARSLATTLFPRQPAVQQRFIEALARANPEVVLVTDPGRSLVPGSTLRMPDWRDLGAGKWRSPEIRLPRPVTPIKAEDAIRIDRRVVDAALPTAMPRIVPDWSSVSEKPVFLRLSPRLGNPPDASETLRETLRLEYRLLTRLSEQLATSMRSRLEREEDAGEASVAPDAAAPLPVPSAPAPAESPPAKPVTTETPVAETPAVPPSVPTATAPVESSPRQIRQVQTPAVATASEEGRDWLVPGGAVAIVAALLFWLARRRRQTVVNDAPVVTPPPVAMEEETVLAEPTGSSVSAREMEAFFSEPRAASGLSAMTVQPEVPAQPDDKDINPVIELAEIMLSFGRIQGAAQTLQEYIEANPKEALLPWMKLLDIYRSGDMRDEFDELAAKLHQTFNVEIQHWDLSAPPPPRDPDIPPKAMTIEEIPHIRDRIVSVWEAPGCLDYLHQLLRDNRGGSRAGFTLPVVQEIMLLIDILVARDATADA